MTLHDSYARLTPFELLFARPDEAEDFSAAVAEESEGRGADVDRPHAFVTMGVVTDFIRRIEGEGAPPEAIHQYGALAFHALHFHRAGHPLFLLGTHAARYLVEGAGGSDPRPPAPTGYLQLPQHLFWMDEDSGAPLSVDGIFWHATPGGSLHAMLATGVRADRSGVGVVPLPEAPLADASTWLDVDIRGDGTDFRNPMPGAELDGLYRFATAGEVLKLLARFFAYAQAVPGSLVSGDSSHDEAAGGAGPEASGLPFVRVTLEA